MYSLAVCALLLPLGRTASEDLTEAPTASPTEAPTLQPTFQPTEAPTLQPTEAPTFQPTEAPTVQPTEAPTLQPTEAPTLQPTEAPTLQPTESPIDLSAQGGTITPTEAPTESPTTEAPTGSPTAAPTNSPTLGPTMPVGPLPTCVWPDIWQSLLQNELGGPDIVRWCLLTSERGHDMCLCWTRMSNQFADQHLHCRDGDIESYWNARQLCDSQSPSASPSPMPTALPTTTDEPTPAPTNAPTFEPTPDLCDYTPLLEVLQDYFPETYVCYWTKIQENTLNSPCDCPELNDRMAGLYLDCYNDVDATLTMSERRLQCTPAPTDAAPGATASIDPVEEEEATPIHKEFVVILLFVLLGVTWFCILLAGAVFYYFLSKKENTHDPKSVLEEIYGGGHNRSYTGSHNRSHTRSYTAASIMPMTPGSMMGFRQDRRTMSRMSVYPISMSPRAPITPGLKTEIPKPVEAYNNGWVPVTPHGGVAAAIPVPVPLQKQHSAVPMVVNPTGQGDPAGPRTPSENRRLTRRGSQGTPSPPNLPNDLDPPTPPGPVPTHRKMSSGGDPYNSGSEQHHQRLFSRGTGLPQALQPNSESPEQLSGSNDLMRQNTSETPLSAKRAGSKRVKSFSLADCSLATNVPAPRTAHGRIGSRSARTSVVDGLTVNTGRSVREKLANQAQTQKQVTQATTGRGTDEILV